MGDRNYTASTSQSQGREGWSIIFRHPVAKDRATGKPGRRIRRGLGTRDQHEAVRLVSQMNEILADRTLWEPSARAQAERRFDLRVVDIFYQDLAPGALDFFAVREGVIPLPSSADSEYRRVLMVGTTGSGKTTLVRQILGTRPETERFPSTSTAKTTVAETELVLEPGVYRAVVTFLPRDQVRDYVEECLSAAVLAAYRDAPDDEVLRRSLNHVNQRFRLNYVLGNGSAVLTFVDEDDEVELDFDGDDNSDDPPEFDLEPTNRLLDGLPARVRSVARRSGSQLRDELRASQEDERVVQEIFEENLDDLLREDEEFQQLADELMEEVERRFELLNPGRVEKTKQGWPRVWCWECPERTPFLKIVSRFSSNYAGYFGTLLTPLVSGIRVAGPFGPTWNGTQPALVLLDGEGLGHTPDSSASLPTTMTRRIDDVDAVVLVDNGEQPMQAAAVAVMRNIASGGKTAKLLTVFTHLDSVVGDNLPTFKMKENHVRASAENALTAIGQQLGPYAERAIRKRLEVGCFFVGGIQRELSPENRANNRAIRNLKGLLEAIDGIVARPEPVDAKPAYDRMNLVLAVKKAAEAFHEAWWARLGREVKAGVTKEHWTRIKALTRRFAEGWADEYDTLRPVADLHRELKEEIYQLIQSPVQWHGQEPDDDGKQVVFDQFADGISSELLDIAKRRLREDPLVEWQEAFNKRGTGSSYSRAAIITDRIYEPAVPIPTVAPTPDRNRFLHEIVEAVSRAAERQGVVLQ